MKTNGFENLINDISKNGIHKRNVMDGEGEKNKKCDYYGLSYGKWSMCEECYNWNSCKDLSEDKM